MKRGFTIARRTLSTTARISPRLGGRLTYRLFAYPGPRAKVRSSELDVHRQADTAMLRTGGHRVMVYRWGDGRRPVLMLHGWGSRASRFAPLVAELVAAGLSPVAFDAPGHGGSSGRGTHILEYAAVSRRLQEQSGPFDAVVGHSFGALAGFLAVREDVTARRLVVVSSPCDFGYLTEEFSRQLRLSSRIETGLRRRVERFFEPETDIWQRFSASHQPAELRLPMLVVHDDDDPVVHPGQAKRIVDAYGARQVRTLYTSGLGHHRILSDPGVVGQLAEFIASGAEAGVRTRDGRASSDHVANPWTP